MTKLNLVETVYSFLKDHPDQRFTARQIAEWILKHKHQAVQAKKQRSQVINTDEALLDQLVREISAYRPRLQRRYSEIKDSEERPRKYYYSGICDTESGDGAGKKLNKHGQTQKKEQHEAALYPLLPIFLQNEFGVYVKRIDEKTSSNNKGKGANQWLYPDFVGIQDIGENWESEIKQCIELSTDKRVKLWSFEVKVQISRLDVRACYFQAVSNSSWANVGYLVAAEIVNDHGETMAEARMLASIHGIGLIQLNTENPADSQVLIPARERDVVDWHTANRLAEENRDFRQYVRQIIEFYKLGKIKATEWDDFEDILNVFE